MTDRVTADQPYNEARCTEAWLYTNSFFVQTTLIDNTTSDRPVAVGLGYRARSLQQRLWTSCCPVTNTRIPPSGSWLWILHTCNNRGKVKDTFSDTPSTDYTTAPLYTILDRWPMLHTTSKSIQKSNHMNFQTEKRYKKCVIVDFYTHYTNA